MRKSVKKIPLFKKVSNKVDHTDVIICSCASTEHQVVFRRDKTYPEVYMHVHLVKHSFWYRLKYGIKYIFGHKSRYGAWDEFILTQEHTNTLVDILDHLNDENLHSISYH